jgi:hypothetical protein
VTRCERCASYAVITRQTPTYPFPSAAGQSVPSVSTGSSSASASRQDAIPDPPAHAAPCLRVQAGHDTRALQHYLGYKNIQHTVRYTEMAPYRFKDFWRD